MCYIGKCLVRYRLAEMKSNGYDYLTGRTLRTSIHYIMLEPMYLNAISMIFIDLENSHPHRRLNTQHIYIYIFDNDLLYIYTKITCKNTPVYLSYKYKVKIDRYCLVLDQSVNNR